MEIETVWKKIKHQLYNAYAFTTKSLLRKMLFSFFTVITVTVSTLGLYYYTQSSSDMKRREIYNMERLTEQSAAKLSSQMANIKSAASNYFSDLRFQHFVMTLGSNPESYNEFTGNIGQFVKDHSEVEFFVVSQLEGNRFIKGNISSRDVMDFEQMKDTAIANNGKGIWVSSAAYDRQTGKEVRTLTFVQAIKKTSNFQDFQIIGVMMIQLSYEYLKQWLMGIGQQEGVHYYLVDSETEKILIAEDPSFIGKRVDNHEIEDVLYVPQKLATTRWVLVSVAEVNMLLKDINGLARNTIYFGLICLLGAMLIAVVLSSRILNPLKELKKGILAVEKGDYDIILPVRFKDETGYIIHRFNQMTAEIKALVIQVYEADLVRKEAEIKSLQSQINPHFLYNTLGIIDSLAMLQEDERIGQVSRSLAKMFRYNISPSRMSNLQAELRQLELYLYIQMQRYENKFSYSIEVEEDLYDVQTPKLLLQPLVENCFVHAFDLMSSSCELRIRIWSLSEQEIYISIWNNGPTIAAAPLSELQSALMRGIPQRNAHSTTRSIGLLNVQQRIQLLYGKEFGLKIHSEQGYGTKVLIILRRLGEEELEIEAANR